MNRYLVKIAKFPKLVNKSMFPIKPRNYLYGGSDELDAARRIRVRAAEALKAVRGDEKTRAYIKGAFKDVYKDTFDPKGLLVQG